MSNLQIASSLPDRYHKMTHRINEILPRIDESNKAFFKSDSQVKMVSLDITDVTQVGSAKHILARIERKREALIESEFDLRRKEIKLERKKQKRITASGYEAELLDIDIADFTNKIESTRNYQSGAIRELAFLIEQYDSICQKLGVEVITEEMYEEDQARYHVMRAFSQALAAARARGGLIDEGNFIYFQDLGINGAAAQREVVALLEAEQEMLNNQQVPTFEMQYEWLQAIGDKFCGEVSRYAKTRGFIPFVEEALATKQLQSK